MPSVIKRKTSHVEESAFRVYAGDEPRPGGYRALLKTTSIGKSSGDNLMLLPILELKAKPGSDKAKFDGYPIFPNIPLTDAEANVQREQAFYLAVCGKKDADLATDGAPEKFKAGDKQKAKVLKIGGVKPENIIVNVRLRQEVDNRPESNGALQLKCDLIFAARDEVNPADVEDEDEEDQEELEAYEEDDLLKLALPALRAILVDEFGLDAAETKLIKSKKTLIEKILEEQDAVEDEDEEDEEEEDEDEEDESDEDEEEEDEEEDDPEAEARSEAAEMDRNELKAAIKKRDPSAKFRTSQTVEDLIEIFVPLRMQDPPF